MRALLLSLVVVFSACDFEVKRCSTSADCTSPGVCSAEGLCVLPADAGAGGGGGGGSLGGGGGALGGGGGALGGGGGGTAGGGGALGGGGGATGGGGGVVDLCAGVSCGVGHACAAATGECVRHVTSVEVVSPASGALLDAGTVSIVARVNTDGTVVTMPVQLGSMLGPDAGPALVKQGADYAGTAQLADGTHQVTAKLTFADGGAVESLPVSFRVDTVAPQLALSSPLEAGALQRDSLYRLDVSSNEPVVRASVGVSLQGVPMVEDTTGVCMGLARCWTLDMSKPALEGKEGTFTVTATAMDLAGNVANATLGTVTVKRVRWEVTLNAAEQIRAAPAIGADGTVYVGTVAGNTGTLHALNPEDGGAAYAPVGLGAMVSVAAAVSNDAGLVFFSANDSTGGLVGARTASLSATGVQAIARGNSGAQTYSAIGLAGGPEVGAVTAFNSASSAGRVYAYWPSTGFGNTNNASPNNSFDFSTSANEPPNNIVVDGTTAYLLTRPGGVGLYRRPITSVVPGNNLLDGVAQSLATTGGGALTMGQALVGGDSLVGGMTLLGSYYRVSDAGVTSGNLTVDADNGMAAYSGTKAFAGRGDAFVSFDPAALTMGGVTLASVTSPIRTAPILGEPRPGATAGRGYTVAANGELYSFPLDGAASSGKSWGNPFTTSVTVQAHPNLDCNRRVGAATTTTGVMYVATMSGKVAAIIVDSPKLLTTSGAWPRYQRTAGNAGNPAFPLNAGCN